MIGDNDYIDLEARYDSRDSFYGKAKVRTDVSSGLIVLISYNTNVATIDKNGKVSVIGKRKFAIIETYA